MFRHVWSRCATRSGRAPLGRRESRGLMWPLRGAAIAATVMGVLVASSAGAQASGSFCGANGSFAEAGGNATCTYSSTGSQDTFAVPLGVDQLTISAVGGQGAPGGDTGSGALDASTGGFGDNVTDTIAVTPGQVLYVEVGGNGSAGGFNGGGSGGSGTYAFGGTGGGSSDVRTCSESASTCPDGSASTLASRLLVAAGGGGGGAGDAPNAGGNGGGAETAGSAATDSRGTAGGGQPGTSSGGGAAGTGGGYNAVNGSGGTEGSGGQGADASSIDFYAGGGGGGGGLYGGGGAGTTGYDAGGGGGGSDLVPAGGASSADTTGVPLVSITFPAPATLGSVTAPASGLAGTAISGSTVSVSLSGGQAPSGSITFKVFGPQSSAPSDCASGGTTVGAASVSGDGTYSPSTGFTPSSGGDYWWYASYGGDSSNGAIDSGCGSSMAETVVSAPVVVSSPPPPPPSKTSIGTTRARVRHGKVKITLGCSMTSSSGCAGKLVLMAKHGHAKATVVAQHAYKLTQHKGVVTLKLTKAGRKLLARHHRLRVTAEAKPAGQTTVSRTVTLIA